MKTLINNIKKIAPFFDKTIVKITPFVDKIVTINYAIKYASVAMAFIGILIASLRCCNCRQAQTTQGNIFQPKDTNCAPIVEHDFRPASIPLIEHSKPPVKLPKYVHERDVKRVLVITKRTNENDSTSHQPKTDKTSIIELKNGDLFVDKQNGEVQSVDLYNYRAPILDWELFVLGGITFSPKISSPYLVNISPVVALCPLQICGAIQFPILAADLRGIGAGGAYHEWKLSIGLLYGFDVATNHSIILIIGYNF